MNQLTQNWQKIKSLTFLHNPLMYLWAWFLQLAKACKGVTHVLQADNILGC